MGEPALSEGRRLDKKNGVSNGKLACRNQQLQSRRCPECASQETWKCGIRSTKNGGVQRYLCRNCGFRFSQSNPKKILNRSSTRGSTRQICVSPERKAKNLVKVEPLKGGPAGATTPTEATFKGKIIEFMWRLKREGYADSTISTYAYILKNLLKRGANLYDCESVKDIIALQDSWGLGRKRNVVKAYSLFLKMQGLSWKQPR